MEKLLLRKPYQTRRSSGSFRSTAAVKARVPNSTVSWPSSCCCCCCCGRTRVREVTIGGIIHCPYLWRYTLVIGLVLVVVGSIHGRLVTTSAVAWGFPLKKSFSQRAFCHVSSSLNRLTATRLVSGRTARGSGGKTSHKQEEITTAVYCRQLHSDNWPWDFRQQQR